MSPRRVSEHTKAPAVSSSMHERAFMTAITDDASYMISAYHSASRDALPLITSHVASSMPCHHARRRCLYRARRNLTPRSVTSMAYTIQSSRLMPEPASMYTLFLLILTARDARRAATSIDAIIISVTDILPHAGNYREAPHQLKRQYMSTSPFYFHRQCNMQRKVSSAQKMIASAKTNISSTLL